MSVAGFGSPPRARGAGGPAGQGAPVAGITPACAGSSGRRFHNGRRGRDHPRVRGEQGLPLPPGARPVGSPPRARGAGAQRRHPEGLQRITPACAGSSPQGMTQPNRLTDHPRVRGEQATNGAAAWGQSGSPPRARGAEPSTSGRSPGEGITPACAGSRGDVISADTGAADHPRVRGEQNPGGGRNGYTIGSPPRARGAERLHRRHDRRRGITPACAGSRLVVVGVVYLCWDHPRVRGEQSPAAASRPGSSGSPPRARGAGPVRAGGRGPAGITPACAGSSWRSGCGGWRPGDHPRVRGEQVTMCPAINPCPGSPPRARGADDGSGTPGAAIGITPACAGSSCSASVKMGASGDHPRVRGEQSKRGIDQWTNGGSPPRARGAAGGVAAMTRSGGITPACAGSSACTSCSPEPPGDHPRVRGEQAVLPSGKVGIDGSPPRARGAVRGGVAGRWGAGITPACAGSRATATPSTRTPRDHPRVRGEQGQHSADDHVQQGSPPRARGAGSTLSRRPRPAGITPACAGSRVCSDIDLSPSWDHPRVRGEQKWTAPAAAYTAGSPPRARGAGMVPAPGRVTCGITPACAGSRTSCRRSGGHGRDHPRVRGEQSAEFTRTAWVVGSPPRARGAGVDRGRRDAGPGITPACAGSSRVVRGAGWGGADHPRVRGEQGHYLVCISQARGSPPRARGAVVRISLTGRHGRITPACAGSRQAQPA